MVCDACRPKTVAQPQTNRDYQCEPIGYRCDTYCFEEPLRHRGTFNGVVAGNCTEIMEYTSPDEIAVCNLASVSLPSFVTEDGYDFDELHKTIKIMTKNLNRVIDINFYPVDKAKRSNMRHRPIGIGVQGLADVYLQLKYPFDSEKASQLNMDIFETIYHASVETSMELAREHGSYETFERSPMSQGIFQFDMWTPRLQMWIGSLRLGQFANTSENARTT